MKLYLLAVPVALACAGMAHAADDVVIRPDQLTATLRGESQAAGRSPTQMCLIVNGADHLDPSNHISCVPIAGLGEIGQMTVSNPLGAGNTEYRAVVTLTDGTGLVISEPSANKATVQDLPLPPVVVP